MRAKSSTLNHQEGAALLDEQPASLKITVNALPSSAPSPILTSGRGGGEEKALFHSRVEILCQSRRQSSQTIRPSAGVHFLFPSQDGAGFAKKKKSGWFLRFDELESTFRDMHRGPLRTFLQPIDWKRPKMQPDVNIQGVQAGRPMNKR